MPDILEDPILKKADELGKQHNNLEMNIQAGSAVTDGSLSITNNPLVNGETSWRDAHVSEDADGQEDSATAVNKAEDDVDFVKSANNE